MNYWINSIIPFSGQSRSHANRDVANLWLMGIGGVGLGAGLMFLFDPARGRRRRALGRDQLAHAAHLLRRAVGATSRDLSHRAYGVLAEATRLFRREEISELVPNKLLAWRSVPGSAISHSGVIHFESNHEGSARVHIELWYRPLAGAIGHALARLFGADPKSEMDADLARMKTFIERGHPPHDAANPLPASREPTPAQARTSEATTGQQAYLAGGP